MKFYFFTSGIISQAQLDTFWAEVRALYPTAYYTVNDVSDGSPNGDEDGFAIYGPLKDWQLQIAECQQSGKPVYFKDLI